MIKTFMLTNRLGLAFIVAAAVAATPVAAQPQSGLTHTPITDPAAFLAGRSNESAAPVTAGMPDSSFGLDKAPLNLRGISRPIADNAAYGHIYTDAAGLYTFVLAQGWSWKADSADPRAVHFWGGSGNNGVACSVTPIDYRRGPASLAELQAVPENIARATFEQGIVESLGWKSVDSRGVVMIGDGRTPVRALSWSATSPDGKGYDTVAVIEAPANALMVMCAASNRPKLPESIIKVAFRVAEGALVPGNLAASPAPNANWQGTVKKILAEGKSRLGGTQQQPVASGVAQATGERQKLQTEFDNALARKDRDTIYRIGPKIKDVKFCQYVYNDPSATKQQLYDGASSCPSGPMFDALTQRYIKSAAPQTAQASSPASTPSATYSAPVRPVESAASHSIRIQRQTDYEIREMNRRIDNAGRR